MYVNESIVTAEQQDFYSEKGYLVVRDFFLIQIAIGCCLF